MASCRPTSRVFASRHLVCGDCISWIHYDSSGCGKTLGGRRGQMDLCSRVEGAGGGVSGARDGRSEEFMKETVTRQCVEDKGADAGSRVA